MPQPLNLHCSHCGAQLAVTDEYLMQYGGQDTTCPVCKQVFTLPTHAEVFPTAPPTLHYAGSRAPYQRSELFYDGQGLVMVKGCVPPHRCVKCNEPTNGYTWSKTLYWHPPLLYFLILFPGLLIYAIVAMLVRKSAKVSVGLCPVHRAARTKRVIIATISCFVGVGLLIGIPIISSDLPRASRDSTTLIGVISGIVILLAGLVYTATAVAVVTPRRIDEHFVYLKRAGEPFLQTLPPFS
jgi:hypothetical protein